jgi:hypothetical protein
MDAPRKRSRNVPLVGLGGTVAVLAGLGMLGTVSGRAVRCDEARVVTNEGECTAFVGAAKGGECIRAFAEARARGPTNDVAAFARKTRNGSTDVFGLVRDERFGWRKLDGTLADRAYRSCDRAASRAYSSSTRSVYSGAGRTTYSSSPSRPSTVGRGGFGSTSSGIRASS